MKFLIIVFILCFIIAVIIAVTKRKADEIIIEPQIKPTQKRKNRKVQSYIKYEKKVQQKKGKLAMDRLDNITLSIEEANELFIYNNTTDESTLLDAIIEAKLNGSNFIKLDRYLYDRLKQNKNDHEK